MFLKKMVVHVFLKRDMFCGQMISLQGWNMLYADEHVED